jgi:hypothetical protein
MFSDDCYLKVKPRVQLAISVLLSLILSAAVPFANDIFPVTNGHSVSTRIIYLFRIVFVVAWVFAGPIFICLNSWELKIENGIIIYSRFFGVLVRKYTVDEISAVNLNSATQKNSTPNIILEFFNGGRIKIEHWSYGFKDLWICFGGESKKIFTGSKFGKFFQGR